MSIAKYFPKLNSKRIYFAVLIFIPILILVFVLLFSLNNRKNSTLPISSEPTTTPNPTQVIADISSDEALITKSPFPPDEKIAQVKNEIIYGSDLNYLLYSIFPGELASPSASLSDLKEIALPVAINNSVLLQSDNSSLPPAIFNNPNKNQNLRTKRIEEITSRRKNEEETVSGGMISVWYHNVHLPTIPLDEAEILAKSTIEKVYYDIKNGIITFQEGGNRIRSDSELAKIDPNYKGNAYMEFTDITISNKPFTYPELNTVISSLKEGEMSEIIKITSPDKVITPDEEFFAIIKVFKRKNQNEGSFYSWLDKEKRSYEIVIF